MRLSEVQIKALRSLAAGENATTRRRLRSCVHMGWFLAGSSLEFTKSHGSASAPLRKASSEARPNPVAIISRELITDSGCVHDAGVDPQSHRGRTKRCAKVQSRAGRPRGVRPQFRCDFSLSHAGTVPCFLQYSPDRFAYLSLTKNCWQGRQQPCSAPRCWSCNRHSRRVRQGISRTSIRFSVRKH